MGRESVLELSYSNGALSCKRLLGVPKRSKHRIGADANRRSRRCEVPQGAFTNAFRANTQAPQHRPQCCAARMSKAAPQHCLQCHAGSALVAHTVTRLTMLEMAL